MTNQEKTLDEKVAIVLEMLKGKASVEEICQRYQVSITDAYHWCALFLDDAKKAFEEGCDEEQASGSSHSIRDLRQASNSVNSYSLLIFLTVKRSRSRLDSTRSCASEIQGIPGKQVLAIKIIRYFL